MHIATHALLSWLCAEAAPKDALDRRSRLAITLAGIAPDLDAFGAPVEWWTDGALPWFSLYHHKIFHNGLAALAFATIAWLCCRRDWRVFALALVALHLHFLCDIVGSRGPDGYDWPIPYLLPFSPWEWRWSGQWALNAWQNLVTTYVALFAIAWLGARRGRTPMELIRPSLDARIVSRLKVWFRQP
ncbi:MAG TPA: metal-dependent hydrolase [Planctomycetes bacterium]|nr:metal-dependent hydrolase [Planctomycetota bacterium]